MRTIIALLALSATAQATPVLFYLDHISGPKTGGRNNNGAVICVAGRNFGSTQGSSTVTIGGGAAAEYIRWTSTEVCFALGAAAATGNVVVTVGGNASNGLPFTVRTASIYFAGSTADIGGSPGTASDSNSGDFDHPKATLRACKNLLTSGSGAFCYVRDSVSQTGTESVNAAVILSTSGTLSAPLTLAGWPGDASRPIVGDYVPSSFATTHSALYWYTTGNYWSISRLWLRAAGAAVRAMPAIDHLRLTNTLAECPAGDGGVGCVGSAWTVVNPSQSMEFKVFGNEMTNIGCGEGTTSGPDNSAGLVAQSLQYPCQPLGVQSGTLSMSGGSTMTISGASFGTSTTMYPGLHLLVDTDGDGTYEDSVLASVTTTTATLYSNSFVTTTFSGAPWKYRPFTSSKLYHVTYWGGDNNGTEMGWNWIHNNSAQHGINFHATAQTGPGAAYQVVSTVAAGTPARMTLVSPFTATSGQPLYNGQRLDVVGNSTLPTAAYYVSLPTPGDYGTIDLYNDVALTSPVTLASTGTGGNASRTAFGPFNLSLHDNIVTYQNGACLSLAQADPDHGAINVYNNTFDNCGTGPITAVGGMALPGVYMLNSADVPSRNLNGSGTVQFYQNTMYAASTYASPPSGSTVAALWMNPTTTLYFRARNNIIVQPSGLAFSGGTAASRIIGFSNVFSGTSTSTIPSGVTGSLTSDPLFTNAVGHDFTLGATSPAIDSGDVTEATTDQNGVSRPQGLAFDRGALERFSGTVPVDPLTITTASLPDGVVGGAYSQAFSASGGSGTQTWDVTVNDAPGLAMSPLGVYGGTPLLDGVFNVTARVTDASGSATRSYTVTIAAAPLDPSAVTVTLSPAATSMLVSYGASGLVGNQTCVIDLKQGSTVIQTQTDSGGRPSRVATFTGIAAGAYTATVTCAPFGAGTGSSATATAATGLTTAAPVYGFARSEIGAAKMRVQWGYTSALTGTPVTVSCSGGCSTTIPGVATGGWTWFRLAYLNSSDAIVAIGEPFTVTVH